MSRLGVVVALLLAACPNPEEGSTGGGSGGSGGGRAGGAGGGGAGGGVGGGVVDAGLPDPCAEQPSSGFCLQLVEARCDRQIRCGEMAVAQRDACVRRYESDCASLMARVDAGARAFDADAGAALLGALASGPCVPRFYVERSYTVATGRIGAPCEANECVEGYCPSKFNSPACFACTARARLGASCVGGAQCERDAGVCLSGLDGGPARCEAKRADGLPCSSRSDCASDQCVQYKVIDGGAQSCGGALPPGSVCSNRDDCQAGHYCAGALFFPVRLGQCAAELTAQQPCAAPERTGEEPCAPPLTCLGGRCVQVSSGSVPDGGACWGPHQCAGNGTLFCAALGDAGSLRAEGVCTPLLGSGEQCVFDRMPGGFAVGGCATSHWCSVTSGCTPLAGLGEVCSLSDPSCKANLHCRRTDAGDVCARDGVQCDPCLGPPSDCTTGRCAMTPDGGRACAQPAATGASCSVSSECRSARCVSFDGGFFDTSCAASCF